MFIRLTTIFLLCTFPFSGFGDGITQEGNTFVFSYSRGSHTIEYLYSPGSASDGYLGTLHELQCEIDGLYSFLPSSDGGPYVQIGGTTYQPSDPAVAKQLLNTPSIDDNGTPSEPGDDFVEAVFRWSTEANFVEFTYRLSLSGPTLVIDIASDSIKIPQWKAGRSSAPGSDPVIDPYIVPYMPNAVGIVRHASSPVFVTCVFDVSVSQSTRLYTDYSAFDAGAAFGGQNVLYDRNTAGTRRPVRERLWVTASPNLEDLFAELPSWTRVSSYREDLKKRVVYDNWLQSNFNNVFARDLRTLYRHGLRDLLTITHVWQRFGYDNGLPDHVPPAPGQGGEAAMRSMLAAARQLAYRVALHENYCDHYENAPSYDPARNALNADGSYTLAWYNPGTHIQSYLLKPTAALAAMRPNAAAIADYGVTAGCVDVISGMGFGDKSDHDAAVEGACSGRTMIDKYIELMDYARTVYNGPFLGEGGWSTHYAGVADGIEPALTLLASWDEYPWNQYPPIVDYDLLRIHPRMVNHGPGYHTRFFGGGTATAARFDTGRAHTVAFGRAGFIDTSIQRDHLDLLEAFREYYCLRALQERLATDSPTRIRYEKDGVYRTVSQAILENNAWRVRVEWDCGVTVWVNNSAAPWDVNPGDGTTYSLAARNGWLAYKPDPDGIIAYSTNLQDGTRVDYNESGAYTYKYASAPQNTGAAASVPSDFVHSDLHSVAALSLAPGGAPLLQTSARGSSNLTWRSRTSAIYRFSDSSSNSVNVTYLDAPDEWMRLDGTLHANRIAVWRLDSQYNRVASVSWIAAVGGQAMSWVALKDVDYELTGPLAADTDEDGLTDAQETMDLDPVAPGIQNPFDPTSADSTGNDFASGPDGILDAYNDWDGDGVNNAAEFLWGTNPADPDSWPALPVSSPSMFYAVCFLILVLGRRKVIALHRRKRRDFSLVDS
jgi:hypothetical protein